MTVAAYVVGEGSELDGMTDGSGAGAKAAILCASGRPADVLAGEGGCGGRRSSLRRRSWVVSQRRKGRGDVLERFSRRVDAPDRSDERCGQDQGRAGGKTLETGR